MRLLWAKALDDYRTAIVIDDGMGQLLGGVVLMTEFTTTINYHHHWNNGLTMKFYWEWFRVVNSPEDFEQSREWEHRELAKPVLMLTQGD